MTWEGVERVTYEELAPVLAASVRRAREAHGEKTWTFCGHWEGSRIVVDYVLPGAVADVREDNSGQFPDGLWAAAASGLTVGQAQVAAVAEYEAVYAEEVMPPPKIGRWYESVDDGGTPATVLGVVNRDGETWVRYRLRAFPKPSPSCTVEEFYRDFKGDTT